MFYSEQLLSRDGPLAYVWLAANVEKRLTKQQFLNTSITESARAIESSSIPVTAIHAVQHTEVEPMALRLTGQLLYGVVRIYSKKTKYLFDDVTDALYKLKSSFKTSQSVILPPESTVVSSLTQLVLQDTVTEADLLYQEPFNLDEILKSQPAANFNGNQLSSFEAEDSFADDSIEIPRVADVDELDGMENDLELNLDFDLEGEAATAAGADESVELGRAAGDDDANASALGGYDDYDLPDFQEPTLHLDDGFDDNQVDEPLTPDHSFGELQVLETTQVINNKPKRARQPTVYEKVDVVRTSRKRIVVDTVTEISSETMKRNQKEFPIHPTSNSVEITDEHQLSLIKEMANPVISQFMNFDLHGFKRRRLGLEMESENLNLLHQHEDAFDVPYDFDLPTGFDDEQQQLQLANANDDDDYQVDNNTEGLLPEFDEEIELFENKRGTVDSGTTTTKATIQIANQIREKFDIGGGKTSITFTDVIESDMNSGEPLSKNPKREATRAFFELLVLATADTIELKQHRLFGEVEITCKESFVNRFL